MRCRVGTTAIWVYALLLAFTACGNAGAQVATDLTPGQPLSGQQLSGGGDIKYYRVSSQAGMPLFVLLNKDYGYWSYLSIAEGVLPARNSSYDASDQALQLTPTTSGYCYVRVECHSSYSGGSFTIAAHSEATFPRLTPGTPLTGEDLAHGYSARWYQIPVSANAPAFVLLNKSYGYWSYLSIAEGVLPPRNSSYEASDQSLQLTPTASGYCYVRVECHSSYSGGAFTIAAHSEATFPRLTPGTPLTGEDLAHGYSARWYQIPVSANAPAFVLLNKSYGYWSYLSIAEGVLPPRDSTYDASDQALQLTPTTSGYCYVRVECHSSYSGGTFTIAAHSEATFPRLTPGTPLTGEDLAHGYSAHWYQAPVSANAPAFVLLNKSYGYWSYLSIAEGVLPPRNSTYDASDQALQLTPTTGGYCYVRVECHSSYSGGTFTIAAHTEATFPRLTPGTPLIGQNLAHGYSAHWYQVPVSANAPVFVLLNKSYGYWSYLSIAEGVLPLRSTTYESSDQVVQMTPIASGYCYVRIECHSSYSGGTFTITAQTQAKGSISGYIEDRATHGPIADAAVVASLQGQSQEFVAVVDVNGEYSFTDLPVGSYTVQVFAPGYVEQSATVTVSGAGVYFADFELTARAAGQAITGVITDKVTGKPLGGIRVDAQVAGAPVSKTYTTASGRYELVEFAPKTTAVSLEFSGSGYNTATQEVVLLPDQVQTVNDALAPKFTLSGSLMGIISDMSSRVPVSGAQVAATMMGVCHPAGTSPDGGYYVPGLEPGAYLVRVSAPGYMSETRIVSVSSGSTATADFAIKGLVLVTEDINRDGKTDALDIQLVINAALGLCSGIRYDCNHDGRPDAIDIQLVINSVLGL